MKGSLPDGTMNTKSFQDNCKIIIYGVDNGSDVEIVMQSLPDISDGKGAQYADETSIGRAAPFKTYQNSDNRSISWDCHFVVTQESDIELYFKYIRAIQAAVYPQDGTEGGTAGAPYLPPPLCQIKCGNLLSKDFLNVVMKQYSLKFDTQVPWHEETYLPYKFDVSLQFDVIYEQSSLPGMDMIFRDQ